MDPSDLPAQFFTLQSILTLGGASAAVLVVANTARKLFGWKSVWVGFVASLVIVFYGAYATGQLKNVGEGLISLLNGALLFCTAYGMNESLAVAGGQLSPDNKLASDKNERRQRPFFTFWTLT